MFEIVSIDEQVEEETEPGAEPLTKMENLIMIKQRALRKAAARLPGPLKSLAKEYSRKSTPFGRLAAFKALRNFAMSTMHC